MTLPLWNKKWHCHVIAEPDSQPLPGSTVRMWRREKVAAANSWCWTYFSWYCFSFITNKYTVYIFYIHEVNNLIMESNLWSLNIEMVPFTEYQINSLQNWGESYCLWTQIWMISTCKLQVVLFLFSFPRTCTHGCFVMNFMSFGIFVVLPIATWDLLYDFACYFMWFVFFVWLFVYELSDPDDVFQCSLLKYTEESEESR